MAAFEGVEPSPITEWPRVQAPFVPGTPNALTGAPGRNRTRDPPLTRRVLFQLSYKGMFPKLSAVT